MPDSVSVALRSLCHPEKLATLRGERPANDRVGKIVYWLEVARLRGDDPTDVMTGVMSSLGWDDLRGRLTAEAMVRNRLIAERLGCLDEEGMALLRRGRAPVARRGPYAGESLHVDHILPVTIAPELRSVLANLELMPASVNLRKSTGAGSRQVQLARSLRAAGLADDALVARVEAAAK